MTTNRSEFEKIDGYWRCIHCGCKWRDNANDTVSLFDANQHSCFKCESLSTAESCEWKISVEQINHPKHYGGSQDPYEAIKVIEAWGLGFCLGNVVKYICRAGNKEGALAIDDLKKAEWYLQREISMYYHKQLVTNEHPTS